VNPMNLPHDHGHTEAFVKAMPQREEFQALSQLFQQLSDGNRLRLFWILCHCEQCVINLSAMMQMSSPAVSHHLRQLKDMGLVVSRRDGKEVYYKSADTPTTRQLHQMAHTLLEITCPENCPFE